MPAEIEKFQCELDVSTHTRVELIVGVSPPPVACMSIDRFPSRGYNTD